ncbi:lipase [Holotrichia oblita]|uniref:Lipase n=1 Tax=Holotrichia oblita TaxID=644536 RepID=A0ACB9SVA3_HOLOL|nr:lipase [Holotrichia oblita]
MSLHTDDQSQLFKVTERLFDKCQIFTKCTSVAEGYLDESISNKRATATRILNPTDYSSYTTNPSPGCSATENRVEAATTATINTDTEMNNSTKYCKQLMQNCSVNNYTFSITVNKKKIKQSETGIKVRPKPKGKCVSCCPTGPADIQLQLFSKFQRETPVLLPPVKEKTGNYENLKRASTIIIYIHGFMEITDLGSANNIKNAYLSRADDYAVIIVDWSELVSFPWYFQAVNNIESVAKLLVTFLETYTDAGTINIGNIHMIGFSLGAHVAGHVGQLLRKGLKIRRITALDPALPGFKSEKKRKLSKSAAEFVDVIHTDGGNFGNIEAVGHVDFYPNGVSCSHNRAHKFFVNSIISPYDFPAVKCLIARNQTKVCNESDTAYMGIAAYFK